MNIRTTFKGVNGTKVIKERERVGEREEERQRKVFVAV